MSSSTSCFPCEHLCVILCRWDYFWLSASINGFINYSVPSVQLSSSFAQWLRCWRNASEQSPPRVVVGQQSNRCDQPRCQKEDRCRELTMGYLYWELDSHSIGVAQWAIAEAAGTWISVSNSFAMVEDYGILTNGVFFNNRPKNPRDL